MAGSQKKSPVKKWKPATEARVAAFGKTLDELPAAERRTMFGYPAAFVHGNMVAGLHEAGLVLRLAEADALSYSS